MSMINRTRLATWLVAVVIAASSYGQDQAANPSARWEKDIARFEQQDKDHPVQPGGVLFVGSSSIRMWDLEKSFPGKGYLNRGFGGSEMADVVYFFDRIVAPYKPRLIVLYEGDNDLAKGKRPQQVVADFSQFITKMHEALPGTRLLYIPVKPSLKRWSIVELGRETNRAIQALCEADDSLTYVDLATPILGAAGKPQPDLFREDGLHLNEDGYALWTRELSPYLVDEIEFPQEGTRVFPAGSRPTDARLKPLRHINDKYHPWTPPATRQAWEEQAARIRQQVLVACGLWPMPEKQPLEPVVHGLVDRGDYTVERVYFASRPGLYVTGSLYRPKHVEGKVPGVLCPHGHWANGRFFDAGKGAAQQLEIGAESFMSGAHYPLQARMVQLARMGCVVFHYDMIGYADNQPLIHREGFNDPEAVLWLENKLGLQTWNSIRALDFLESLPDVDPKRIAVTGASGGGTQTFMICAVDPRPAVAFPAVMVSTNMQGGCVCENADYLRIDVNNIALAALFAPKPMAMSGADDWTIDIETKGLPELKHIYSLYGKAPLVEAHAFPQFKHNYNEVSREMMFNWLNEHLHLGRPAPVEQTDFWPLSQDEMTVFDDKHPLPADSLPALELRKLLTAENQQWYVGLVERSRGNPAAYREAILPAVRVMLGESAAGTGEAKATPTAKLERDEYVFHKGYCARGQRGQTVPTVAVLRPNKFGGGVVLWLDGTGKAALFGPDGVPSMEVRQLADDGFAVVSADLFLTGEYVDPAGGDKVPEFKVEERYPGLTYAYNRPLLAERVQDVLVLIDVIRSRDDVEKLHLIGTGNAGVWVLLARALLDEDAVQSTTVDVQGFAFAQINDPQHPNLLPGAMKYGGLGGLAATAFPAPLTIYGVTADNMAEIEPLQDLYSSSAKEGLQIHGGTLAPGDVAETLLR